MGENMAAKRPPGLDYVLRTPHGRTEFKGAGPSSHAEGIALLFVALPDALARRKVIDTLEKKHAKLLAQESGPDVDQATAAQVAALGSQVSPSMALPSLTPEGHAARLATRSVDPDECAAHHEGHRFGPHGPGGTEQCQWCGEARK
jgi:hypothetical protein